jgi:hypothetical protein
MEARKVTRIVLEKKPRLPQLPNYVEIDHAAIRDAAAAWDAAKAALDESKKTHTQLELELPAAHLEDARADERLRAEGARLKGRPATQAAEKAIAAAEHEELVAQLIEETAFDALQAALDGPALGEWAESVEHDVAALDEEWMAAVNGLVELHATRSRALAIRAMVLGEQAHAEKLGFTPAQIRGIEFASHQARATGYVETGDVFAGLAELGMPPVVEATPVEHASPVKRGGSPMTRGQGPVEEEIAERREFAEAATPELVEERRQRAEQHRQQNEMAEDAERTAGV